MADNYAGIVGAVDWSVVIVDVLAIGSLLVGLVVVFVGAREFFGLLGGNGAPDDEDDGSGGERYEVEDPEGDL